MEHPKLFISYCWSTPEHEQWVIDIATELTDSGVHVILDKWDLKEGHDAFAFMEKMVTDPSVKKVVMICDESYASRADGRSGGVGTETQIISREVYEDQEQDKFVAIIPSRDENGHAFLPAYYKSRIYIDLSEPDKYSENFERLLRWIYDKPLYTRPEIGTPPVFLEETDAVSLGTSTTQKRALSAIKEGKSFASGALDEYLQTFSSNLERFRITEVQSEFDDSVVKNIDNFLPFRNEYISIILSISQYSATEENIHKIHRFFESLLPYMDKPSDVTSWKDTDFDNFKFIIHELFLYTVAILLKNELFGLTGKLLSQQYYIEGKVQYGQSAMCGYYVFREYIKSLEHRNKRLKLNRLSVHADLLKERVKGSGLDFKHLMQADFLLFIRADLHKDNYYTDWFPDTLLYLGHFNNSFEIFARSSSSAYFEKVKEALGISDISKLSDLLEDYAKHPQNLPRWLHHSFSPKALLGYEHLSTRA
ncbi:SEFIR domain-containing protein [Vibrio nitrifigilis]|uniref:TIR domain-containing protein n=1 Tax=Vibrio nitrifigilis TaxID=2789781 RepID=A0ABS0GBV9_9VIBR|nr:TIR domain-containing protein [Vibrio nitrifigilis]MBF8999768.1 TIR domain-containing protein [Vibrio nitrifigilis]